MQKKIVNIWCWNDTKPVQVETFDFDDISYGDVSEIIHSYFTNSGDNWIGIFREHCSWSDLSIFGLISGITSPGGHHGPQSWRHAPFKARTSILPGVTAPQACNKASRNLVILVGGLSISLINIWSQMCSIGFRSGFQTGHLISCPAGKLRTCRAVLGVALSCPSTHFR